MLHDSLSIEQVVDSGAALEFMKEASKLATTAELDDIGQRLEHKSRVFQELLSEERIGELDELGLERVVGMIFSLRRKSGRLVRRNGLDTIRSEMQELLYGDAAAAVRFERFVGSIGGVEPAMLISLASETLHYTRPDQYWLWTHWIWNPKTGTGALPLVTTDADLQGENAGEVFDKVARATAAIHAGGEIDGYSRAGLGPFSTDVLLACVYAVYMYTVFRVKLSQEFNRILPELPELVERVLGVHRLGDDRT